MTTATTSTNNASRVRHVVESDMVAHLWAHQSQDHARNKQNNFKFNHGELMSYGTPIARIYNDPRYGEMILVTGLGYSNTTRRVSILRFLKTSRNFPRHRARNPKRKRKRRNARNLPNNGSFSHGRYSCGICGRGAEICRQ